MQISPDKDKLLFGVTWYDWHENKGNREAVYNKSK